MPLKTLVKVGSITNLSDARYCAGMGVEMLGFRAVQGQENFLAPKEFQEIRGWVTGPQMVAELFGIQQPPELNAILENYKPDYVELGLKELALFTSLPLPFILFLEVDDSIDELTLSPSYIITRGEHNNLTSPIPHLVEVTTVSAAEQALNQRHVRGIAMNGSSELRPGLKEYNTLADILELLDVD